MARLAGISTVLAQIVVHEIFKFILRYSDNLGKFYVIHTTFLMLSRKSMCTSYNFCFLPILDLLFALLV